MIFSSSLKKISELEEKNSQDILIGKILSGNASPEELQQAEDLKNQGARITDSLAQSRRARDNIRYFLSAEDYGSDKQLLGSKYNEFLSGEIRRVSRRVLIYRIAAILAFPVALAAGWYGFGKGFFRTNQTSQICVISAPPGNVSKTILPDGTGVWINSGSSVSYNTAAFNHVKREVQLTGEAYFQVSPDKGRPFIVETPHASVKVTGTSFNIIACPDDPEFETILAEGSVELRLKLTGSRPIRLNPGQRITYNSGNDSVNIQEVDAEIYTSWRNLELIFKDASLNDLIRKLDSIYDIRFHLEPASLGDYRFRGMFRYNNNLIEALEKIKKSSGINYYIENKEVWLRTTK